MDLWDEKYSGKDIKKASEKIRGLKSLLGGIEVHYADKKFPGSRKPSSLDSTLAITF